VSIALADLLWTDADAGAAGALLVVPIGATEQHGPHLPLSTDTDIAVALAEALSRRSVGARVVVAPAVAYGSSGEHEAFAGTISIGQEAFEMLVVELVRSASATFESVVLVSTHGGNREPLDRAIRRLRNESRNVVAWSPDWSGDAHAGRVETSIMLALHPERVNTSVAQAGNTAPLPELLPALRARGVGVVSANGVLGDPAGASAEEGLELLAAAADDLRAMVGR
jgi:mycofactocin system creatininase family protein